MKKELIILAFYFDIANMTRQQAQQHISEYIQVVEETFDEEELKEYYNIKTFFLPTNYTKIECIYPTNMFPTTNIDIEHQIKEVETEILKHKDPKLWKEWTTLMRWAKLRNLDEYE